MSDVMHLLPAQNELGEGPLWDIGGQALWWVDIKQNRMHVYYPDTRAHAAAPLSSFVTAFGFRRREGLVTAGELGLALWDETSGQFSPIHDPEPHQPGVRFNDGKVDPGGRFWAGTMNEADAARRDNKLYRLDADHSLHLMLDDVGLANGLGWSPDRTGMYFTDTARGRIDVFDYDLASGEIENRRLFASIAESEGFPDGMAVDSEGCVWSAIWGGAKVIRFDAKGQRMAEYRLPVANVTSCAFGGRDLSVLFITTAWTGLRDAERAAQPLAGDLFCMETTTRGQPANLYAG